MIVLGNIFTAVLMTAVIVVCFTVALVAVSLCETLVVQKYYEWKARRAIKNNIHKNIKNMEMFMNELFENIERDVKAGCELAQKDMKK